MCSGVDWWVDSWSECRQKTSCNLGWREAYFTPQAASPGMHSWSAAKTATNLCEG